MLDGILGRGFSGKCKSLMKTTVARIEVVRRRAEAKQRYLNEDLAKLLSNGLDINAYGRTEEFLSGMNLLWCYDFVEQSCEYIVKQLTRMQKQGECPEECREAVASLMYAAARFSDLPELRELRDVFQQRYGNCLEPYVNQKFVEKLSYRPSPKERRLRILQDIALESSIKWDSRGLERTMATPSVVAQVDKQKVDIAKQRPGLLDEKSRVHGSGESNNIWRRDGGGDLHISRRKETIEYKEKSLLKSGGSSSQDDDVFYRGRQGFTESKCPYPVEKRDAEMNVERLNLSSHGKILDNNACIGYTRNSNGVHNARKVESAEALFHDKTNFAPSSVEHLASTEKAVSPDNSIRKRLDEGSDGLKSCSNYALPPPYTKSNHKISQPPYVKKPKEDKYKLSRDSQHAVPYLDKHLIDASSCNRSNIANSSSGPHSEGNPHDHQDQFLDPDKIKSYGHEKELDYQDQKIPLPKPRSIRRKHHKPSSSSHNVVDALEDVGGSVGRSSSIRRKDHSKKGLHMLLDEENHRKGDEERMIDKLLIHYSKKPSSYDAAKLRKKLPADGESSVHDGKHEVIPFPSRSISLPHEQVESKKVFARSNTFQPDHQAGHVHPKLPDYDDLAARFAALKGR